MGKSLMIAARLLLAFALTPAPALAQSVQVPGMGALNCRIFLAAFLDAPLVPSPGPAEEPTPKVAQKLLGPDQKGAAKAATPSTQESDAPVDGDGAAFAAGVEPRQPPRPRDRGEGPPQDRDMADWLAYCTVLIEEGSTQ